MVETSRRQTLKLIGAGAAALGGSLWAPHIARAAGKITVLNWQGYVTDEPWAVKTFAEKTGIEVVHDYFSSEPEMITKLRTNPGVYDVVLINSARTQQAASEGLISPVDLGDFANATKLAPNLARHANLLYDGKLYGVAWLWGMTALAIYEGKQRPGSYAALGDPAYKGRAALLDDAVTNVAVGALLTGQDINNPSDLAKISETLKSFKDNIKLIFTSEDQWNKVFAAKEIDISEFWSGASLRARKVRHLPVEFIVPKEGAIGFLDGLSIPVDAPNLKGAQAFIDYMISPELFVEWASKTGASGTANMAAMDQLPADDPSRKIYTQSVLDNLKLQSPLPDDRREAFNNLWEEMKAYYAT